MVMSSAIVEAVRETGICLIKPFREQLCRTAQHVVVVKHRQTFRSKSPLLLLVQMRTVATTTTLIAIHVHITTEMAINAAS